MFGKKILGIVGLLFLGSQITTVSATCAVEYVDGAIAGCSSCNGVNADGTYFVEKSGSSTKDILVSVTESASTAICTEITVAGYYKAMNNKFYKNDSSGAVEIDTTDKTVCSTAGAGGFTSGGSFCLAANDSLAVELNQNQNYLFTDVDNIFGSGANAEVIIHSPVGTYAFVKNSGYTTNTEYEFCVDSAKIIQPRAENWCASEDCSYYTCANGVCVDISSRSTCDPTNAALYSNCNVGFYIRSSTTLLSEPGNGDLYECSGSPPITCAKVGTGTGENGNKIPKGYLINADLENFEAVPFIQCNGENCSGVAGDPASNCSGKTIGDLIVTTEGNVSTYQVCHTNTDDAGITLATYDSSQDLSGSNPNGVDSKKYIINVANDNANAFGDAGEGVTDYVFAATSLNKGSLTTDESNSSRYLYTHSDANEIEDRGSNAICNAGTPKTPKTGQIAEYKKSESGNLYMDNTANIAPN